MKETNARHTDVCSRVCLGGDGCRNIVDLVQNVHFQVYLMRTGGYIRGHGGYRSCLFLLVFSLAFWGALHTLASIRIKRTMNMLMYEPMNHKHLYRMPLSYKTWRSAKQRHLMIDSEHSCYWVVLQQCFLLCGKFRAPWRSNLNYEALSVIAFVLLWESVELRLI